VPSSGPWRKALRINDFGANASVSAGPVSQAACYVARRNRR